MVKLNAAEYESFEAIKQTDENGNEFWYARNLQKVLDYSKENFIKVIDRAMPACQNSSFDIGGYFTDVSKTLKMPNPAEKQVTDYKFTWYACLQNRIFDIGNHFVDVNKMVETNPSAEKRMKDDMVARYAYRQKIDFDIGNHFVDVNKMVETDSGAAKCMKNGKLQRHACLQKSRFGTGEHFVDGNATLKMLKFMEKQIAGIITIIHSLAKDNLIIAKTKGVV